MKFKYLEALLKHNNHLAIIEAIYLNKSDN